MSVTFVRVVSFSTYQVVKYRISEQFERYTGVSPLVYYNQPGSVPTLATITTFTVAGMCAGLAASPFACAYRLALPEFHVLIHYRPLRTCQECRANISLDVSSLSGAA